LQSELTDRFLVAAQEKGYSVSLLKIYLPLEFGVPEAAAVVLCCLGAPRRSTVDTWSRKV
jgi:hypothetical protein